jgi:hypothetical protein
MTQAERLPPGPVQPTTSDHLAAGHQPPGRFRLSGLKPVAGRRRRLFATSSAYAIIPEPRNQPHVCDRTIEWRTSGCRGRSRSGVRSPSACSRASRPFLHTWHTPAARLAARQTRNAEATLSGGQKGA